MVPFPVTLSDFLPRFHGHGVIIDALDVLWAQLMRDLFAIAKFLLKFPKSRMFTICKTTSHEFSFYGAT